MGKKTSPVRDGTVAQQPCEAALLGAWNLQPRSGVVILRLSRIPHLQLETQNSKLFPVRVLFDHQLFSLQDVGGASRYHFELARYLATCSDVRAELFLGLYRSVYPFRDLSSASLRVRGVQVPLPRGLLRYSLNETIESAASLLSSRYDIYHPTYFRRMPTVRARRSVFTVCDCTYEQLPHLFRDSAMVIRSRRAMFRKVDFFICISEATRQGLLHVYPIDPGKTCVIHLGLSHLSRSQEAGAALHQHVRRPYLLFVGTRGHHKNFNALLQAFRDSGIHANFDLLAVGGGPLSRSETAGIASLGLGEMVICVPFVTDEFLAEAYARAQLFVYPSLSEGFGIPPLEAMSAGCPVAASNVTAIPEVCQDALIYFDPYDVTSIAAALVKGVYDSEARGHAIARGREVAAGYSWEKCGAATLAAYCACL